MVQGSRYCIGCVLCGVHQLVKAGAYDDGAGADGQPRTGNRRPKRCEVK